MLASTNSRSSLPGDENLSAWYWANCAFLRTRDAPNQRHSLPASGLSPGWVSETLAAMGQAYSAGTPAAVVAQAYKRSLVEDITGQVIPVKKS
jgi:hypothetical protein